MLPNKLNTSRIRQNTLCILSPNIENSLSNVERDKKNPISISTNLQKRVFPNDCQTQKKRTVPMGNNMHLYTHSFQSCPITVKDQLANYCFGK